MKVIRTSITRVKVLNCVICSYVSIKLKGNINSEMQGSPDERSTQVHTKEQTTDKQQIKQQMYHCSVAGHF